jgi:hypothetical protein
MSRVLFFAASAVFLLATLASGWLHGSLVNRWGQADALQVAAARLDRGLPPRLGHWRLVKTLPLEEGVGDKLQCAAALHAIYTSEQTGDSVVVAVLAGPSGPLTVHTPEICYSANDYELAGERQALAVTDKKGQQHSLWQLHANSRHSMRPNLRVLYGWSQGHEWQAVRGPRFALAGLPVLYKLQLAGPARDTGAGGPDPCQEFLGHFLAEIQPRLVASSRVPSLAP